MKKNPKPPVENNTDATAMIIGRIAQLACMLRDSIHDLAVDKIIAQAAESIPDTRDRLAYVIEMTAQAANSVLNCVDAAQPHQNELELSAKELSKRWDEWLAHSAEVVDVHSLATDTRDYLKKVPEHTAFTRAQLREIMMAQDFQDLTGQVIKRMMNMIHDVENQLMVVLKESVPRSTRAKKSKNKKSSDILLNGPQIDKKAEGIVVTQDQVDDLLDSLGL